MIIYISYFILSIFVLGSIYMLGLMIFLDLRKKKVTIRPLDPDGNHRSDLPKAA